MIKTIFNKYFELAFWVFGLACLAFTNPSAQSHFSLCPLKALGFSWCPGCGLGHAISFLLHGYVGASFHAHWFGIPALLIILYRIAGLCKARFFDKNPLSKRSPAMKGVEIISNTEF